MRVKQASTAAVTEIQQARNNIRRSWNRAERDERRRIADARQQWLFKLLYGQQVTTAARVA